VISGMYFGWNLGLEKGGTLGLAISTLFIIVMYVTFTFGYTELACAIPKAGGAFVYAHQALGRRWAFLAGMAQNIEFIFAPPAIAFAMGAYFNLFFPSVTAIFTFMEGFSLMELIASFTDFLELFFMGCLIIEVLFYLILPKFPILTLLKIVFRLNKKKKI